MYKKLTLGLPLIFFAGMLSAVEIDTKLLDEAKKVRFIEDKSPVSRLEYSTGKQIRDTGRTLGKEIRHQEQIQEKASPYVTGAPSYKYKAMRIYASEKKAGADVIYISTSAGVSTTKGLFRIVSGYIEAAYNIPMEQADKIAVKVCWWNNNHYDENDYFAANFNPEVLAAFSKETAVTGLAASYKYWPGKTRIVIPFVFVKQEVPAAVEPAPAAAEQIHTPQEESAEGQNSAPGTKPSEEQNVNTGTKLPGKESDNQGPAVSKISAETFETAEAAAASEIKKQEMPVNYRILFGILIAAAVLLVMLLIKVIRDIHKHKHSQL
jgi:hypothetical protein